MTEAKRTKTKTPEWEFVVYGKNFSVGHCRYVCRAQQAIADNNRYDPKLIPIRKQN